MNTISYEDVVVKTIGEMGVSQILMILAVKLCTIIVSYTMLLADIIILEPDWWKMSSYRNLTLKMYKQCPQKSSVYSVNEVIVFDDSMKTIVSEWVLVCDKSWIPRALKTLHCISVILGALIVAQLSDWYGRRECLVECYCTVLCAVLLQSFATNWYVMLALTFIMGFGIGGFLVCADIYCLEFVGTTWRTLIASIPAWGAGMILLGATFSHLPDWRLLSRIIVITGFPVLVLFCFCPRSVRWLLAHEDVAKAKQILETLAVRNQKQFSDFNYIDEAINQSRTERYRKLSYNYVTLFYNRLSRFRVWIFALLWIGIAISYFVFHSLFGAFGDHDNNRGGILVLFGLIEVTAMPLVVLMAKLCGRRFSAFIFLLATSSVLFSLSSVSIVGSLKTFAFSKIILSLLGAFLLDASCVTVKLFTMESFPTILRNVAYGFNDVLARVGSSLAPMPVLLLHDMQAHLPFTMTGILLVIGASLCSLLKDTQKEQLQDVFEKRNEGPESLAHSSIQSKERSEGPISTPPLTQGSSVLNLSSPDKDDVPNEANYLVRDEEENTAEPTIETKGSPADNENAGPSTSQPEEKTNEIQEIKEIQDFQEIQQFQEIQEPTASETTITLQEDKEEKNKGTVQDSMQQLQHNDLERQMKQDKVDDSSEHEEKGLTEKKTNSDEPTESPHQGQSRDDSPEQNTPENSQDKG